MYNIDNIIIYYQFKAGVLFRVPETRWAKEEHSRLAASLIGCVFSTFHFKVKAHRGRRPPGSAKLCSGSSPATQPLWAMM